MMEVFNPKKQTCIFKCTQHWLTKPFANSQVSPPSASLEVHIYHSRHSTDYSLVLLGSTIDLIHLGLVSKVSHNKGIDECFHFERMYNNEVIHPRTLFITVCSFGSSVKLPTLKCFQAS